jgi:hypothetical protein
MFQPARIILEVDNGAAQSGRHETEDPRIDDPLGQTRREPGQASRLVGRAAGSPHRQGVQRILELLSLRKGTILTKDMFRNHLYGGMDGPDLKIIDVFVCNLRKKLARASGGSHYIETVWGRGYVLLDRVIPSTTIPADLSAGDAAGTLPAG